MTSERPLARRLVFDWGPALAYMALIWWLSSRRINVPTDLMPMRDKGVHFVEYASLGFVLARATLSTWPHVGKRAALAAVIATFAWGVLDELHQAFVPGRSADLADLLADGIGAVVGVSVFYALWLRLRRGREGQEQGLEVVNRP